MESCFFQTVYHVHLPRESDHLRCITNSFKNSKFFQMPLSMTLLAQVAPPVNEKQVKLTKQEYVRSQEGQGYVTALPLMVDAYHYLRS